MKQTLRRRLQRLTPRRAANVPAQQISLSVLRAMQERQPLPTDSPPWLIELSERLYDDLAAWRQARFPNLAAIERDL